MKAPGRDEADRVPGIGVIGCGTIAYWSHLRSLKSLPNVRVSGLFDPDPVALERAGQLVNAPVFSSLEDMLSSEAVDAVVIASPAGVHAHQLGLACQAGVHAYVEKPVAHDSSSLDAVRACVAGTGLTLASGFNFRFHPACLRVRRLLAEGVIGEVRAVASDFAEPVTVDDMPPWKRARSQGGGVLLDLATHHIDLYRWFLQDELEDCRAETRSLHSEQDSATWRAATRQGVELTGYFSFTSGRSNGFVFHGAKGVLRLDLHSGQVVLERNRRQGYGIRRENATGGLKAIGWRIRKSIQPSYNPSHRAAMAAFVMALITPARRDATLATVNDGLTALEAVLESEAGSVNRGGVAGTHPGGS